MCEGAVATEIIPRRSFKKLYLRQVSKELQSARLANRRINKLSRIVQTRERDAAIRV